MKKNVKIVVSVVAAVVVIAAVVIGAVVMKGTDTHETINPVVTDTPVSTDNDTVVTTEPVETVETTETEAHADTTIEPVVTTEPEVTTESTVTETEAPVTTAEPEVTTEVVTECIHTDTEIRGAVEASCTTDGYTGDIYCKTCGKLVSSGSVIAAHGHTEVKKDGKDATCTEDGYTESIECSVCHEVLSAATVIKAHGHTVVVTVAAKAATCTTAGCTEGTKCSVCGQTLTESQTIKATGHTAKATSAKAATCTTAGHTAGSKCSVCGTWLVAEETIPAKGHTAYVFKAGYAATCGSKGRTDDIRCSECNEILQYPEEIPITGEAHNYVWCDDIPATCTTMGYRAGMRCTVCECYQDGKDHSTNYADHVPEIIPAVVGATCEDDSWTEGSKCANCGLIISQPTRISGSHDYSVCVETHEATSTAYGYSVYKCSKCGKQDLNGHDVTWPTDVWPEGTAWYNYDMYLRENLSRGVATRGLRTGSWSNVNTVVFRAELRTTSPVTLISINEYGREYHPLGQPDINENYTNLPAVLFTRDGTAIYGWWEYDDQMCQKDIENGVAINPGWCFIQDYAYLDNTVEVYGWCYNRWINDFVYGYYSTGDFEGRMFLALDQWLGGTFIKKENNRVNDNTLDDILKIGRLRNNDPFFSSSCYSYYKERFVNMLNPD